MRLSEGIQDPLYVTALIISAGSAAAGNTVVKGSLTEGNLANFAYLNGDFKLALNGGNIVLTAK